MIANEPLEDMEKLKYFGKTKTNHNCIHDKYRAD
jgi:hypothetical protein